MKLKKLCVHLCLIVFLLTGCNGNSGTGNIPEIEDCTWQMATIQDTDTGQVIAHNPDITGVPDTSAVITLKCNAGGGTLTLTDETGGQTYTGTYKLTEPGKKTRIYEVSLENQDGLAVISMTTYHANSQAPAFIITLKDYALNFFPN